MQKNLIYVKIDIGNINNKTKFQKIDFFLTMEQSEFYFNFLDKRNFNKTNEVRYPDLQYNNYILLKSILNFFYYNSSLCQSPFNPLYISEKMKIVNETINLIYKNDTNEKGKIKQIIYYIPYKDFILYDHRPGVMGLNFNSYFILNIRDQIPIKLENWVIKYNDYLREEGELIIGGLPQEYDGQHFKRDNLRSSKIYHEENIHPDWNLKFIKSYIISNDLKIYKLKENTLSNLRIEEFFILGTDEYFQIIQEIFFNYYINQNICKKQMHKKTKYVQNYLHIICYFNGDKNQMNNFINEFPILKFYQSEMNYNFTLNGSDLFTIIPDNNRILFNIEFLEGFNKWVFGKPFFKKYQMIFDEDSKMIKYYIENNSENISKKSFNKSIKYIIIGLLSLLIIMLFVFCLSLLSLNKNVKKNNLEYKNYELSEYFYNQ